VSYVILNLFFYREPDGVCSRSRNVCKPKTITRIICTYCGKSYANVTNLQNHISDKHGYFQKPGKRTDTPPVNIKKLNNNTIKMTVTEDMFKKMFKHMLNQ
jgi:hypothetical protein